LASTQMLNKKHSTLMFFHGSLPSGVQRAAATSWVTGPVVEESRFSDFYIIRVGYSVLVE